MIDLLFNNFAFVNFFSFEFSWVLFDELLQYLLIYSQISVNKLPIY